MGYIIAITVGALAGLHASIWGSYKDGPYEGFRWRKFVRSTLVGAVLGGGAHHVVQWDLGDPGHRFVWWGLIYCLERAANEFWKYFLREEDQSKYTIPMQFGVFGVPMKNAPKRIAIGLVVAAGCVAAFFGIEDLEASATHWPPWLVVITVGGLFGWISAFGGAWKDAPIEGFETLKFFRSPSIAIAFAGVTSLFVSSWAAIALAAEGFTVAAIETYKTFFYGGRPPGKFAGKPIVEPAHLTRRRAFVPAFAAIWALVVAHLVLAVIDRGWIDVRVLAP